jgi:hypothetical protein
MKKKGAFAPAFEQRALMNQTESRLFSMLVRELPDDWTVMTQVSYGAFLSNRNYQRYMTVNSKRADFVVLGPSLAVEVVVEYQGKGHYGKTKDSRARAETSDQIKRQALNEAGIPLYEVPVKFDRELVQEFAKAVIGPHPSEEKPVGAE